MFNSQFAYFIPNENANAKSTNPADCKARLIESHSMLGPFFRISLLPYMQNKVQQERIVEPLAKKIKHIKYQHEYLKVSGDFQKSYGGYVGSLGK